MEPKEVFQINGGTNEVIHRNAYEIKPPIGIEIIGDIYAPLNWLVKNQIPNNQDAVVIVNTDGRLIYLDYNMSNPYGNSVVTGKLKISEKFKEWEINTGKSYDAKFLSEFIKMHRSHFTDKSEAMRLSSELANIKVKVDKEIEKSDNNRGDFRAVLAQKVIESNIPHGFKLNIPLFEGHKKVEFNVEIYINPTNYSVSLISPDAEDYVTESAGEIIDSVVARIVEIRPDIPIINL